MMPLDRITFTVEGLPVPKKRARHGQGRTYTPDETVQYESRVSWVAKVAKVAHQWTIGKDDVCKLHVRVYRPHLLKGGDADNILKSISDACNGILYSDDRRVVAPSAEVRTSNSVHTARAMVTCERYARTDWESQTTEESKCGA